MDYDLSKDQNFAIAKHDVSYITTEILFTNRSLIVLKCLYW